MKKACVYLLSIVAVIMSAASGSFAEQKYLKTEEVKAGEVKGVFTLIRYTVRLLSEFPMSST